jgi:hypothetical protein
LLLLSHYQQNKVFMEMLTIYFSLFIQLKWENRFRGDQGKTCKVTVDGTDFRIQEPTPFSNEWYSHKFKGPGWRYEVAVCIQTGDIVWINGPFKAGKWPDLKIFRRTLKQQLAPGEMVEADNGYRGEPYHARTADGFVSRADNRAKQSTIARHETVNRRLKQWGCLKQVWRHDRRLHKTGFAAVAVITQLAFENGEPPFQCRY